MDQYICAQRCNTHTCFIYHSLTATYTPIQSASFKTTYNTGQTHEIRIRLRRAYSRTTFLSYQVMLFLFLSLVLVPFFLLLLLSCPLLADKAL